MHDILLAQLNIKLRLYHNSKERMNLKFLHNNHGKFRNFLRLLFILSLNETFIMIK